LARQAEGAVHAVKRSDKSVLDGIINSDAIPESDKTVDRLTQEARTLVGAGSETTGSSLEAIAYHVLSNPEVLQRLKQELADAVSKSGAIEEPLTHYDIVQKLPFLTAVINEALRLANSVSGRLARSNPRTAYTYKSYNLPPTTVISMSIKGNHSNESIFPEPTLFKPDRWLVKDEELKRLEKYFSPFGRGSRSCIGKELAVMNLYLMTANFFHKFDAELYQTTLKDIEMEHDFFAPFPAAESRGLRVTLK
jgi:cytochrome P450